MSGVQVKEITYGSFGKCVQISNGSAEVVVTVGFGPRIIRYATPGKENMLCEAFDCKPEDNGWKNYGGHRLWHSPEVMPRTYELENSLVAWEKIENGVRFTQTKEPWTHMAKEIEITMDEEDTQVYLLHRITNQGAWAAEFAIWAVTVMAAGGLGVVPMPRRDAGYLSNRALGLWSYSKMNDPRVFWGENFIALQQDAKAIGNFKFGINNELGWGAYFNKGQVFLKHHLHDPDETYPDGGMSYESYTNDFMLEMESLSPMTKVEPGDCLEHEEIWEIVDNVEPPKICDCCIEETISGFFPEWSFNPMECGCGCCGHDDCDSECDCSHDDCDCGCDHKD